MRKNVIIIPDVQFADLAETRSLPLLRVTVSDIWKEHSTAILSLHDVKQLPANPNALLSRIVQLRQCPEASV